MVKLSIIIVSYNTKECLQACLKSIPEKENIEIFVVDNNSADGSSEMVRDLFPQVILIENRENIGFSAGNNLALLRASGKFILLLNPDTVFVGDPTVKMISFMDRHHEVGACGPAIIGERGNLIFSCRRFPQIADIAFYSLGLGSRFPKTKVFNRWFMRDLDYSSPQKVDYVSAACIMIKRKVLDEIGLLDERFFLYSEEADLCLRMRRHDWQVYFLPEAKIVHLEGKSTIQVEFLRIREIFKSWLKFRHKHYSFFQCLNFIFILSMVLGVKTIFFSFSYLISPTDEKIRKTGLYGGILLWYLKHIF